ncbi:tRNA (adenosine(37)-N6)-threonylcarbamoyltransferase complex ATPase subunit type 1 TsaE [Sulfidibacter corallicola]|uniref:tRNA threonylcarbamoyladenosine biosynthesis protein TsaE n=1 Tax=Sulfidibacter corallicola TaxID=2818388 RepID=A0A8A4TTE5_SULCO|nr:tRNA (adenosine(37)-N6)-threonylcarbamoyltransferase complex ATPase subunit type 1 TsaE [Sulfidibacter corallicola]QTD53229.1 tRNA (adenosine(37)-N6)-threonylcarbamoyltransferase complex ATPase subunit type 1 TsaE [Sulfidibacter corallicola]
MMTMSFPLRLVTEDVQQTQSLAARLARQTRPGDILLLHGDLGAGKTSFVRGFCEGLGMPDPWEVDSPTYTVINHYHAGPGVDHIDLYRFEDPFELEEIALDEVLRASTIKLIEWPERLGNYPCPDPRFLIKIKSIDDSRRQIEILTPEPR